MKHWHIVPVWVRSRISRRAMSLSLILFVVLGVSFSPVAEGITNFQHNRLINSDAYKLQNGYWTTLAIPPEYKVNAVHAALLYTGEILIVAGSGNDQASFDAGTFKTILWNPKDNSFTDVPTPADFFCSGHAFLPDGRLLIAGGTQKYELLAGSVTHAAGAVTVKNENPDSAPITFKKGQRLTGANGKSYQFTNDFVLPPAQKMDMGGSTMVTASSVTEWAEAIDEGQASVMTDPGHFQLDGMTGDQTHDIYGLAQKMTLDKQDFQGTQTAYVFSPATKSYERVSDMDYKRWYPTLVGLKDGTVLAASGLDGTGQILNGQTETFDPKTLTWTDRKDLTHYFPTYPSLFLIQGGANAGRLFYSGSNSGYGDANQGRTPGIWDLSTNGFQTVPGIRNPDQLETSGSILLPPVQQQKVLVAGGGGVGESPLSTSRTDVVDLTKTNPVFTPGPDLAAGTRYPNEVILPDDNVFITGGSSDYRGKGATDNHLAYFYNSTDNSLRRVADPSIGRDYHSEGILLPDGRVVTMGSNPLFSDAKNTQTAPFEQRMEIYTPPYLYHGGAPVITAAPSTMMRGQTADLTVPNAANIKAARLIRPSAATHVTDPEQRSIALDIRAQGDALSITIPTPSDLVPDGWYMLFVTNQDNTPSQASWVHIG